MEPEKTDRDVLYQIGNIAGRPTTHYASAATQAGQMRVMLDEITALIQKQLKIEFPTPDPEKYRTNPGLSITHAGGITYIRRAD
jgi:hypothetical protein